MFLHHTRKIKKKGGGKRLIEYRDINSHKIIVIYFVRVGFGILVVALLFFGTLISGGRRRGARNGFAFEKLEARNLLVVPVGVDQHPAEREREAGARAPLVASLKIEFG